MNKKVLVAMSGGVDSSVSALILKDRGYDVSGVTFVSSDFSCSGVDDAKMVCKKLNINHITLDISKYFREKIIDYFIREYSFGRTPNPCVMCNKMVKFGLILDKAINLGFDYLSTWHYVNIEKIFGMYIIRRTHFQKDQSYYFYFLNQSKLKRILTPLSNMMKNDVRKIAKENNLVNWNKNESQDICFIKNKYEDFLVENGIKFEKGNFLDEKGKILGEHKGIYNYTIGQRRGLGVSSNCRLYVKEINYLSNSVILSENLKIKKIYLENFNFIFLNELKFRIVADIYTRYNCQFQKGMIFQKNDKLIVEFNNYAKFASLGQSAVFYINNILIGGGIISKIFTV